jgi:hypothetical protein
MTAAICWAALALGYPTENVPMPPGPPVELAMTDQFTHPVSVARERGSVLVLVFGDSPAARINQPLRERIFVYFHPSAAGKPPDVAASAATKPVYGAAPDRSPDVHVTFVACVGKAAPSIKAMIRQQFVRSTPNTSVWLDFDEAMKQQLGVVPREANVAVFDTEGRLRMQLTGEVDDAAFSRLVRKIEALRAEVALPPDR